MPKTSKFSRIVFLLFILLFVFINIRGQWNYFRDCIYALENHQQVQIALPFSKFSHDLKAVPEAGYMTCSNSSHPFIDVSIMAPYQQAQFVLSPTILDYFHPLDYSYIVLQCPQRNLSQSLLKSLADYRICKVSDGAILLYRKNKD